jgi:hypothetical protein
MATTHPPTLGGLVKDWGGFEKLITELNQTGDVSVEHDITLIGKSGAPRQIDVLVRHKQGLYEHLVIIDCKHWKKRVGRLHVDALATAVQDLNASRGVLFSVVGFASGAVRQAKHEGIDLFKAREPTNAEWGLPGRHVDFYITYLTKSFSNLSMPPGWGFGVQGPVQFNLAFGDEKTTSRTPIRPIPGLKEATLEALILALIDQAAYGLWQPQVLFDGSPGERSFWRKAEAIPNPPVMIVRDGGFVLMPKINFDIAIKITQTRFQLDRAAKFTFILAVEDCVRGVVTAAARMVGENITQLMPLRVEEVANPGDVLRNGSIMSIWIKGFFPFEEVAHLAKREYRDVITP